MSPLTEPEAAGWQISALAETCPGPVRPWPPPRAPGLPGARLGESTRRLRVPGSESRARRRRGCRGGHLGPPGRLRRLRLNYAARGFESRVSTEDAAAAASHESLMLRPLAAARRGRQCRCRSPGPRRRPTVAASGPARPREKESKVSWEAAA